MDGRRSTSVSSSGSRLSARSTGARSTGNRSSEHSARGRRGPPAPERDSALVENLAEAECQLQGASKSGPSSVADSEQRDHLRKAQQEEEDVEEVSNTSSIKSSEGHPNRRRQSGIPAHGGSHSRSHGSGGTEGFRENSRGDAGSSTSLTKEVLMRQMAAEAGVESSSSGSRTNIELWIELAAFQDATNRRDVKIEELRTQKAAMTEHHTQQMEDMQKQLKTSLKKETRTEEDRKELITKMAALEASQAAIARDLKKQIKTEQAAVLQAQADTEDVREQRDDLKDEMAGNEARHFARVQNVREDFMRKYKLLHDSKSVALSEARAEQKQACAEVAKKLVEENAALQKDWYHQKVQKQAAQDERDILRRCMKNMQASHMAQVDGRTLTLRAVDSREEDSSEVNDDDSKETKNGEVMDPRSQLTNSREAHREMTDELSKLRLQMSELQQLHDQERGGQVGDLKMLQESNIMPLAGGLGGEFLQTMLEGDALPLAGDGTSVTTLGSSSDGAEALAQRVQKAKSSKKQKFSKLASIEGDEVGSVGGSVAASWNVSSDGDGGVEDLRDFEEEGSVSVVERQVMRDFKKEELAKITDLQEKLQEDRVLHDLMKEELAGKDAQNASKVQRLQELLQDSQEMKVKALKEFADMKTDNIGIHIEQQEQAAHQIARMKTLLNTTESRLYEVCSEQSEMRASQDDVNNADGDFMRQQLVCAVEARRISESRIEEYKHRVATMEKQHYKVVAELKQQLTSAGVGLGGDVGEPSAAQEELEEMRQQLRASTEDKNVLLNTFEWKEVQWKSQQENMELQHAAELAGIKRKHETEVKELTLRYETQLADMRARLEETRAKMRQDRSQEHAAHQAAAAVAPGRGWVSLLKCPVRNVPGSSSSGDGAAFCQDVCWTILNTIQGITALMCSIRDYEILEATRTACLTWGSAALHGRSVLTLVNGPSRAAWLRKAFQMHQSMANAQSAGVPGFVIRDLGCEEFTSKTGEVFDSSVLTAHLPEEPTCRKEAALLVIIEPQRQPGDVAAHARQSVRAAPPAHPAPMVERGGEGAHSEVSSVDPSDSASRIADRSTAMVSRD